MKVLCSVILLLVLAGCAPETRTDGKQLSQFSYRWEDPDFKVVCWQVNAGGLSCLPEYQVIPR